VTAQITTAKANANVSFILIAEGDDFCSRSITKSE
jgi:hypothetical protein